MEIRCPKCNSDQLKLIEGKDDFLSYKGKGYIKLELAKPEIGRDVTIGFATQDSKSGRAEYDSRHILQKLIKQALSDTNWRLMSDGINYRLGILFGRIRGYENEEDLLKLIKM